MSESTRADIVELLQVDPDRVAVTPLGVDRRFQRQSAEEVDEFRQKHALERPFILVVGNREPRKNLPSLVDAFAAIADDIPHDLVHAGSDGWLMDDFLAAIERSGKRSRIRLVSHAPSSELALWYSACDCFVMPSLYEGFGLPLLEAMACGAPCIASNRSSLPEVAGVAALLVEPGAGSIAAGLLTALGDESLRDELRRRGPERASSFTWKRTAELTVQVYRDALDD